MGRDDSIPELDIVSHDVYAAGVPLAAYDRFRTEAPVAPVTGHIDPATKVVIPPVVSMAVA